MFSSLIYLLTTLLVFCSKKKKNLFHTLLNFRPVFASLAAQCPLEVWGRDSQAQIEFFRHTTAMKMKRQQTRNTNKALIHYIIVLNIQL